MAGSKTGSGVRERWRSGPVATNVRQLRESAVFDASRPRTDPLLPRGAERLLLRLLGRPLRCGACGREICTALPLVWRGEVWLIGAHGHLVSVSFSSSETLEFRHGELERCPSPERPWVR
jgi:hypothetical protein